MSRNMAEREPFYGQAALTIDGGAMKIVQHAPQARMLLVNRCGHWVQVEHRDLFNRQCLDFLQHG